MLIPDRCQITRGSIKFESTIPYYTYYYYLIKYRTYAVKYGMQGCHYSNYYFYFCSIRFDLNLTLSINEVKKSFHTITCLKSFYDNLLYPFITSPCFSLQYSLILGYTYSMSVLRSINMSVNVELVNIRTILELTGGKSIKLPANILSIVCSSMLCHENLLINGSFHKLLIPSLSK